MDADDRGNGPELDYLVFHLTTGDVHTFDTPADVATFMWGRDFREYAIYKRFPWSDGDLARFREALEAAP